MKIKKQKDKRVCHKKIKTENYKNCFEATQVENKIKNLENEIDVDSLKKNYKEFIKNNKLILKTQKRFKCKSERRNVFNEDCFKLK